MAKKDNMAYWVVSEAAFFAFLYYVQYVLQVNGNLWASSAIMWVLLNIAIIFCPVVRNCKK